MTTAVPAGGRRRPARVPGAARSVRRQHRVGAEFGDQLPDPARPAGRVERQHRGPGPVQGGGQRREQVGGLEQSRVQGTFRHRRKVNRGQGWPSWRVTWHSTGAGMLSRRLHWSTGSDRDRLRDRSTPTSSTRPARASPRSRSTGPKCATRSARPRCSSCPAPSTRPATTRTIGVIILTGAGDKAFCSGGDQKIRGDDGYVDAARRRPAERARPAGADPAHAQAGDRDGRRLRHRRRPRAARLLRPHDRGRQRGLRPDRARRSAPSTAATAPGCWRAPSG